MRNLFLCSVTATLLMLTASVQAASVQQCEDEQGNQSFQKFCPPGSKVLSSKEYAVKSPAGNGAATLPELVLYAVPDCDVCAQMRELLSVRQLAVTEKNVKDNGELQQELKSKTGGELRVPVLLIGETVISGFDREQVLTALQEAGYPAQEAQ